MEESVKMIEEEYGFKIELSVVPWNEITSVVQARVQDPDNMYDVFFAWGGQIPGYRDIDVVLNLQPYFDADPEWKGSFVYENVFKEMGFEVDGDIYGIPFRGTGTFFIYNKTLFDEKGYELPETQDAFETLMSQMVADGVVPMATQGFPDAGKVWDARGRLTDYLLLDAGILLTEEHLNNRLLDYQGVLAEGAELTREWYKNGYFGEEAFSISREEAQNLFFSGNAGLLWCNNNELMDLRALAEEFKIEIGAFNWPAPEGAPEVLGYGGMNDGFAVYAGTKYPEQCAQLIKGLSMTEVQKLWGDRAYSVMSVSGIDYADPLLLQWAEDFATSIKHPVVSNYNIGNLDPLNQALFTEFMMGDMPASDFEAQFLANRARAIENAESDD
jgi:ABC-type glycerol-3-phosphate transport system substrate-binding protein